MRSDELLVASFALAVRLSTLALSAVTAAVVPPYDQSSDLLAVAPLLRGVASWDAVYMRHIALHGYTHEQTHAFYPLYPIAVLRPLSRLANGADPLLVGVLVNLAAFPLAAVLLLRLGTLVLRDAGVSKRVPLLAALAFGVTPAGIFFTAPYTECLFALASFAGMLCVEQRRRAAAVLAFGAAAALRSNGLLYGGFFLWPHVRRLWTHRSVAARELALDLLCAALVCVPTVGVEWYGRALYCGSGGGGETRPYCSTWRPAFYSFVQAHYWNQGFLAYWTLQQVPNFVLAAPMAALCVAACSEAARARAFVTQARAPHVLLLALMVAVAAVGTHVQTLTRFVSANPVVYWYAGAQLAAARPAGRRAWAAAYFGAYTLLGTVLFASFYPWT